jgi:hypothetical protein
MSTDDNSAEQTHKLDVVLKRSKTESVNSLLPEELTYLVAAFSPSHEPLIRSKAYLVLAAFCQGVRNSTVQPKDQQTDSAAESIARVFEPRITSRFAELSEADQLIALSFLVALFQVDRDSASLIFGRDGFIEFVMDSLDIAPRSQQLPLQVAYLLGQASGHKQCRPIVSSHCLQWLKANSRQKKDASLRAACAIALVKLLKGNSANPDEDTTESLQDSLDTARDEELVVLMKGMIIGKGEDSSILDAVEGLAYLSVDPAVKEALVKDGVFLSQLISLIPSRKGLSSRDVNPALLFGIVVIFVNICGYRPRLTEEETQIQKLRRMAQPGQRSKGSDDDFSALGDDEHVKLRGRKLVAAGVFDALSITVRLSESKGTRVGVAKALLNLVEDRENRGKALQSGATKALIHIIKQSLPSSNTPPPSSTLGTDDLIPIQALAKLAITSSPVQVFGPDKGAAYDAIRPLSLMLLHSSATLLQRFEAIMALTNLSSQPDYAERIAKVTGLLSKVEFSLLEDHTMLRRASMELVCNLVSGSKEVFERWGGESKLQILVALSDLDDIPTRLAASGALAVVTSSPGACAELLNLQLRHGRVLPILTQLVDPSTPAKDGHKPVCDVGLIHRGVVCARNFLLGVEDATARVGLWKDAEKAGLVEALVKVAKSDKTDRAILKPVAEVLKCLGEGPSDIRADV